MYAQPNGKRGRPLSYNYGGPHSLIEKRIELLGLKNSTQQIMDLVNLAYNLGKITKEELDAASFIQSLSAKVEKQLGVKAIPSSASHTWSTNMQNTFNNLRTYEAEAKMWNKLKVFFQINDVPANFLKLITMHHSYEELNALKNNFHLMNSIKKGLQVAINFLKQE